MRQFLIKRTWHALLTLFVMATVMFFMFRLLPGDPTATVISPALYPKAQEALKAQFGLDKPLIRAISYLFAQSCAAGFWHFISYTAPCGR